MNYGFIIDNRKCIGCHACSTACKMENDVPLGVYRTWVKYVETGLYPDVRRHFQVTRCNHCANPPCVRICPVTAMYQRGDGIVEFDPAACIGCKACMQACPYDAIYIDPESHTAAKCHYCAHRTDLGLEPACVIVCPEHAIIAGDMDDPASEISRVLAREKVTVRKPEQGTTPKLFYIEGNEVNLHPTAVERAPETFMFADVIPLHPKGDGQSQAPAAALPPQTSLSDNRTSLRTPQAQGMGAGGPIYIGGGRMAEQMVQVGYNAQHKIPWHWPVPAYLLTKAIGAGLFLLMTLGTILAPSAHDPATGMLVGALSLLFIALTTGLLVLDLERPERFLYILARPQWKSWLTRGAFILIGLSAATGMWWLLEAMAWIGWLPPAVADLMRTLILWLGLPLALGAAVYTAFLFGQAEGRDLWQSGLLPLHMLIQSLMAAAGALAIVVLFLPQAEAMSAFARNALIVTLFIDLGAILMGEFAMPHASEAAAAAAHEIRAGRYRRHFWLGCIVVGHLLALLLAFNGWPPALALAGLCSIAGLYWYEYAFVLAPQEIPNS
jgi:Fe-S-cluster-containing dehydrogenase component/formate-dependent nitrite reductase membrane component NrfD